MLLTMIANNDNESNKFTRLNSDSGNDRLPLKFISI